MVQESRDVSMGSLENPAVLPHAFLPLRVTSVSFFVREIIFLTQNGRGSQLCESLPMNCFVE